MTTREAPSPPAGRTAHDTRHSFRDRIGGKDAPLCTLHPRCLAPDGHQDKCTTLRHVPALIIRAFVESIRGPR